MSAETDTLKEIGRLLKSGDVQAAADLTATAEADSAAADATAAGQTTPPAPPRAPDVIILDFMEAVASRFGHHPELENLVRELTAALEPPKPTPTN